MDMAFIKVLNMSISASWLVLAVLVLRFLLKKSPKWIHVVLWALVAVRLICPFSIESALSLIPSGETIPETIVYAQTPAIDSGVVIIDQTVNASMAESLIPQPGASVNPVQVHLFVQENLWCLGMAVMLMWAWISYFRLKKKVAPSIDVGNGVYICDYIDTPFILGIVKPRIYLPSSLEPDSASHVLAHERAHIARKDHWWKPFGYLLLTVYWFNPLLWLAYILLCRDIELACDERVIRDMAVPEKKAYSEALLSCSVNRHMIAACPLAFGEVGVKERVKTVLNYKKPAFWLILLAAAALIVTAVCFLTDPVKEETMSYRVEKVVYRNPAISFFMTEEEAPQFQVLPGRVLQIKDGESEWKELGQLSKIRLSDANFDEVFLLIGEMGGEEGFNLSQLREDNRDIWVLTVPNQGNPNSAAFYLLFEQRSGEKYLAEGMALNNVYPLQENILDAILSVTWLYRLCEVDDSPGDEAESPFEWTSTVMPWDIHKAWAYPYGEATYSSTIEGSRLDELLLLLNEVKEEEITAKLPSGMEDPLWNLDAAHVYLFCNDGKTVWISYADDTLIIGTETDSTEWNVDGYWTIHNENLTAWMEKIANGGTYMLTDENRDEIRRLLRMEHVQLFDPQEYNDLLFVGCAWDNGRGIGVAIFEKNADGYKLLVLFRDGNVKRCASGSELYYCDWGDLRMFLVMNESVTGMEFAGGYEAAYTMDTHPGLVVADFAQNPGNVYRFVYGDGNATTMYMDRNNRTYGQAPENSAETFADPDDADTICSHLKLWDMVYTVACDAQRVDDSHNRAITKELTEAQILELLNLLNGLPETAFEKAEYPAEGTKTLQVFTKLLLAPPYLELKLHDDGVYFRFYSDLQTTHQDWKIHSEELKTFLESFYGGDTSDWDRFAPHPVAEGEITFYTNGMEMTTPNYLCFRYEQTDDGIRFKPKDQSGWVLLKAVPGPLEMDSDLKSQTGMRYGHEAQWACRDEAEIWSYMNVTIPYENGEYYVLLLNEEDAAWVEDFDYHIDIKWVLDNLVIQDNV